MATVPVSAQISRYSLYSGPFDLAQWLNIVEVFIMALASFSSSVCVVWCVLSLYGGEYTHFCVSFRSHSRLRCMCACNRCTYCLCQNLLKLELLRSIKAQLRRVVFNRFIRRISSSVLTQTHSSSLSSTLGLDLQDGSQRGSFFTQALLTLVMVTAPLLSLSARQQCRFTLHIHCREKRILNVIKCDGNDMGNGKFSFCWPLCCCIDVTSRN